MFLMRGGGGLIKVKGGVGVGRREDISYQKKSEFSTEVLN